MVLGLKITLNVALLGAASSAGFPSFDSFIQKHGRTYQKGSAEYLERQAIYEKNRKTAEQQNSRPNKLWTAGVNKLADWSDSEFQTLLGWDGSARPDGHTHGSIRRHQNFLQQEADDLSDLPKEKVWTKLGMSKEVKNQGPCGSCWAIAAATVLEGHYEIYSGKFRTFSTQQMVSCTPNPRECGGKGGCSGATAELALDWVMHHGLADETQVPYTASDSPCTASNKTDPQQSPAVKFGMTGWETLEVNKYAPLVRALAEKGPAVVAAAADTWGTYDSGIFDGCTKDCVVNHAVTAIGYGEENGVKYWLIQNSWGDDWGEAGHIRLFRHDKDEYCGMNNDPQAGIACKGETDPVPVCGMCGVLFDSVVPHFKPSIAQ